MAVHASSAHKRRDAKASRGHQEFRDRLLRAVERLLEDGTRFGDLGISRIVAEAETSRSTFYLHFRDKGQFLEECLRAVMDELLEVAGLTWKLPADAGRADVQEAMGTVVMTFATHARIMVAVSDAAGSDQRVGSALAELMERGRRNLADHIRSGQVGGSVRPGMDPASVAGLLVGMAERGLSRLTPGATPDRLQTVVDSLTHIVWSSLYEQAPSRAGITQQAW